MEIIDLTGKLKPDCNFTFMDTYVVASVMRVRLIDNKSQVKISTAGNEVYSYMFEEGYNAIDVYNRLSACLDNNVTIQIKNIKQPTVHAKHEYKPRPAAHPQIAAPQAPIKKIIKRIIKNTTLDQGDRHDELSDNTTKDINSRDINSENQTCVRSQVILNARENTSRLIP